MYVDSIHKIGWLPLNIENSIFLLGMDDDVQNPIASTEKKGTKTLYRVLLYIHKQPGEEYNLKKKGQILFSNETERESNRSRWSIWGDHSNEMRSQGRPSDKQ